MTILLNIGNTRCQFADYSPDGEISNVRSIATGELAPDELACGAAACVVPEISGKLRRLGWFVVDSTHCAGLDLSAVDPSTVGADRLANAVMLRECCKLPAVSVDFGTAVTFEVVDASGRFLGGAIMPGRMMMMEALHRGTAQLPLLSRDAACRTELGDNTGSAIRLGVDSGIIGGVREILRIIGKRLGTVPTLIGAGGDAPCFLPHFPEMTDGGNDFTLRGVAICMKTR